MLRPNARLMAVMPPKPKQDVTNRVISPMPGVIISVAVKVGSQVRRGLLAVTVQVAAGVEVAVIEAMKMQNKLLSPRAGTVKSVMTKVTSRYANSREGRGHGGWRSVDYRV